MASQCQVMQQIFRALLTVRRQLMEFFTAVLRLGHYRRAQGLHLRDQVLEDFICWWPVYNGVHACNLPILL